jgi:hypothetical protein
MVNWLRAYINDNWSANFQSKQQFGAAYINHEDTWNSF